MSRKTTNSVSARPIEPPYWAAENFSVALKLGPNTVFRNYTAGDPIHDRFEIAQLLAQGGPIVPQRICASCKQPLPFTEGKTDVARPFGPPGHFAWQEQPGS